MTFTDQQIYQDIFNEIQKQPEAKLFWTIQNDFLSNEQVSTIGLKMIKKKIIANEYRDFSFFVKDMMECFTTVKKSPLSSKIKKAAAQDLILKFQSLTSGLINNQSIVLTIYPFSHLINSFERNNSMPRHDISILSKPPSIEEEDNLNHDPDFQAIPGSLYFQLEKEEETEIKSESDDLETLFRDIQFLIGPDLIFKLATFISRLQPEIIELNENFYLDIMQLTSTNRKYVHKYVKKLLKDAAFGKIDPFFRPFGEISPSIKIHQKGSLNNYSDSGKDTTIFLSISKKDENNVK